MRQSEFGEKLEYLRTQLSPNPSQADLSVRLGISQPTLSRYLSGSSTPRWADLPKFAGVFGLSAEQFNAFIVPKEADEPAAKIIADTAEESVTVKLTLTNSERSLQIAIERLQRTYKTYFGSAA